MTPEQMQALIDRLLKTGEFLGTKAFELAVWQIHVKAVQELAAIVFLLLLIPVGIFLYRLGNKMRENDRHSFWELPNMSSLFIFMAVPFLTFGMILDIIGYIMNPEWYAVKLLVDTFLGK